MADYLHTFIHTICSLGRRSAVLHTSCVPPPEVPRGCGLKERGQGWTGPKRTIVARVDSVKSRGNGGRSIVGVRVPGERMEECCEIE